MGNRNLYTYTKIDNQHFIFTPTKDSDATDEIKVPSFQVTFQVSNKLYYYISKSGQKPNETFLVEEAFPIN